MFSKNPFFLVLLRLLNLRTAFSRVTKQEKVCDVRNIGKMLTRKFPIMAAVCTKRKRVLSTQYMPTKIHTAIFIRDLFCVESVTLLVTDVNLTALEMDMQH